MRTGLQCHGQGQELLAVVFLHWTFHPDSIEFWYVSLVHEKPITGQVTRGRGYDLLRHYVPHRVRRDEGFLE